MSVFADTSFFLALFNPSDDHHRSALQLATRQTGTLLSTSAVLIELGNALSHTSRRHTFLRLVELIQMQGVEIVHVDPDLLDRGIALYRDRMDKNWSLTDCISFVVLTDRLLTDAATADHHFKQAGFHCLLLDGTDSHE